MKNELLEKQDSNQVEKKVWVEPKADVLNLKSGSSPSSAEFFSYYKRGS